MKSRQAMWACAGAAVLAASAVFAAPAAVLDETCPMRRHYRFATDRVSPGAMKAEGRGVLGDGAYRRLKKATERSMASSGLDGFAVFRPSALILAEARKAGSLEAMRSAKRLAAGGRADWRELVFRRMWFDPYTAPPPPADWAEPGFDDGDWPLGRGPFQLDLARDLPPSATKGNMRTVHVNVLQYIGSGLHAACYRARFVVGDPAKAGGLTFTATYRGGLRVLVNGRELARGHLPKGPLAPEAAGADYPLAAYSQPALRDRTLGPVTAAARMLRKGVNVLALEVRSALLHPTILKVAHNRSWNALHDRESLWRHGFLAKFELRSPDGKVAPAAGAAAGLKVWVRDMHERVCSDDVAPAGADAGTVRLVGPRKAWCSGQVAVRSDRRVAAVRATASDLRGAGGASIPGSAVGVFHMMPYPARGMTHKLGDERGLAGSFPTQAALQRHAAMDGAGERFIFDQITPRPQAIPAGRCRPLWLSVRIPAGAKPGPYRGTLTVRADDLPKVAVPIELEVVGWQLPDPKAFETYVGLEENPYGVAAQYGVAPWSAEHFKLLEASFRQIARAGGSWLNVPVLRGTEFGNRDDSLIGWTRKAGGALACDFTALDKYLDLAERHIRLRMINFVVLPGLDGPKFRAPGEIMVRDEATGRTSAVKVCGTGVSLAQKKRVWLPLATALHRHLKARGLDRAMHWGYPLDREMDHELVVLLGEHLPAAKWHGGPHQIGRWGYKEPKYYDTFGTVRYFNNWPGFRMSLGWKSPQVHLTIPRIDSSVQSLITASQPFGFRVLVNHSLALGRAGFNRVSADAWASSHYGGMRIPIWIVGMPVLFTLWPGADGAESGARHEALIEGIQEGEARIFLERALDAGRLAGPLARRARLALRRHYLETTFFQNKLCIHELERYHHGWRQRSRELYEAAAAVSSAGARAR